jgi:hypothetical protein
MKTTLILLFILIRLHIFSQDNLSQHIIVIKDTMIIDKYGLIWNCILFSDNSSKVSFFGFQNDKILTEHFYANKTGAFFLKKSLCFDMKIEEEQKINMQISSNYLFSSYSESYQIYESSSPKNNKLTLNNYCYLLNFFYQHSQNDLVYIENGLQIGFGIQIEQDKKTTIFIELRFSKLPTFDCILEGNYLLDELDFFLYLAVWNHEE